MTQNNNNKYQEADITAVPENGVDKLDNQSEMKHVISKLRQQIEECTALTTELVDRLTSVSRSVLDTPVDIDVGFAMTAPLTSEISIMADEVAVVNVTLRTVISSLVI